MVLSPSCQQPGPLHGFWCCLCTQESQICPLLIYILSTCPEGSKAHSVLPGWDLRSLLQQTAEAIMHLQAWPGHEEELGHPSRPACFESSLACCRELPSPQLLAPSAATPPAPTLSQGEHRDAGCSGSAFPLLPPTCCILGTRAMGPFPKTSSPFCLKTAA